MRDPVAQYYPSPSPRASGNGLYPGEQLSDRWENHERPSSREPKADLIAKHFPNGTPRTKSLASDRTTPKRFDFEEALKRIDDRKQLMAKHLSPRSKSIKIPISYSPRIEEEREIIPKPSGSPRTKSNLANTTAQKLRYQYVEDVVDIRDDGPSDMIDYSRSKLSGRSAGAGGPKSPEGTFLPVATPYTQVDDDSGNMEEKLRFEAPGHVDVVQVASYETRTDISDVTGLDLNVSRQVTPRYLGVNKPYNHPSPRVGGVGPHLDYLRGLDRTAEPPSQHRSLAEHRPRRIEIDLTGVTTVEEAILSARNSAKSSDQPKKRHGLPYENTDFRADDEGSLDSWGQVIVTPRNTYSRQTDTRYQPIDVEKLFAEHSIGSPRSHAHITDVEVLKVQNDGVRNLIHETLSAEGEVVVDVSKVEEEQVVTLQSPKSKSQKSPKSKSQHQSMFDVITAKAQAPKAKATKQTDNAQPDSKVAETKHRQRQAEEEAIAHHTADLTKKESEEVTLADPNENPPSKLQLAALKSQIYTKSVSAQSKANAFITSSLETSSKFLQVVAAGIESRGKELAAGIESRGKELAHGIGSELEKLDRNLLPETEINSMLGILDKDLKATTSKLPESKEVVQFLDEQLKQTSCATDNTWNPTSPRDRGMDFSANSIDEMMDSVKQTYRKNIANCGRNTFEEQQPSQPPQTYIVPISLGGRDDETNEQQPPTIHSPRMAEDESPVESSS